MIFTSSTAASTRLAPEASAAWMRIRMSLFARRAGYGHRMTARQEYEKLATDFSSAGVVTGQMFGKPTLNSGGKAIACLAGEAMAFRLGAGTAEHAEALALDGAELFDPSGAGRAMKDWVCVPVSSAGRWADFGEAALRRV
jgi:hypothetical protein